MDANKRHEIILILLPAMTEKTMDDDDFFVVVMTMEIFSNWWAFSSSSESIANFIFHISLISARFYKFNLLSRLENKIVTRQKYSQSRLYINSKEKRSF